MNPNERPSPIEPYSENDDDIEGRAASLQGTSSQYQHDFASSSQFRNPTNISIYLNFSNQGTSASFDTYTGDHYLFSNSSVAPSGHIVCDSPFGADVSSSNSIPFFPQGSQSYLSEPQQSSDNANKSPLSGASGAHNSSTLKGKQVISRLGPDSDIVDSPKLLQAPTTGLQRLGTNAVVIPTWDLKQVLISCAQALSDGNNELARDLMDMILESKVSFSGEPIQRLGAYLLVGLRKRLRLFNKALKWQQPTSRELLSYKRMLCQICPHLQFAHKSACEVIREAMKNESRIHIIDFQIGQGFQWYALIQALAFRPEGPPLIRITGFDDCRSQYARGGGLRIVGQQLYHFAKSLGVSVELHSSSEYGRHAAGNDLLRPGEAVAVCFPYSLQSYGTVESSRNGLLRFVKSLSPKVVTLAEIECNTNTSSFNARFLEVMNYYTAVFESIDVARPRNDMQRIGMEQECFAGEIINMIGFDEHERVNRHELFERWRLRFAMAGFTQCPLSPSLTMSVSNLLKDYNENYRHGNRDGTLYLGWKNTALATFSTWK